MRRHVQRAALLLVLCLACAPAVAAGGNNRLTDIRYWTSPTYTRLVFDLRAGTAWKTLQQKDARRLVIELDGFDGFLPKKLIAVNDGIVRRVRAYESKGKIRVVIDLDKPAEHNIFALKKIDKKPPRLVIDVNRSDLEQAARVQRQETARQKKRGDAIVVIDPGHGGEDPGAVSAGGTYEKDLVLAMGKKLAKQLGALPGIRAYLTRKGDYFIPLGKRIKIAEEYGADLFLSLHVNAGFSRKAGGSSVYCLSFKGASNNVARIAEARENASDSIGGVPLEQQKSNLNVILCDLVQTHTINSSVELAGRLLAGLGKFNKLYLEAPQEANFAVLRAPDIPSVLIEADFISTPDREKMLKGRKFQNRFVKTIAQTVAAYLAAQPQSPMSRVARAAAPASPKAARAPVPTAALSQKAVRRAKPPVFQLQPPKNGKYRIVKKSDTGYALMPSGKGRQRQQALLASPLPQPDQGGTAMRYHVVRKNETLSSIARLYGLPLRELCRQNKLAPETRIAAGIKLKVVPGKSSR